MLKLHRIKLLNFIALVVLTMSLLSCAVPQAPQSSSGSFKKLQLKIQIKGSAVRPMFKTSSSTFANEIRYVVRNANQANAVHSPENVFSFIDRSGKVEGFASPDGAAIYVAHHTNDRLAIDYDPLATIHLIQVHIVNGAHTFAQDRIQLPIPPDIDPDKSLAIFSIFMDYDQSDVLNTRVVYNGIEAK